MNRAVGTIVCMRPLVLAVVGCADAGNRAGSVGADEASISDVGSPESEASTTESSKQLCSFDPEIGLPASEAVCPPIVTADGEPMNSMNNYVIRMTADEMPPAEAFWSVTLYDTANGFFIPNDRKKYSVGANAGMQLDDKGGIAIYIAAEKPDGVPEENWLPINREDIVNGPIMRLYEPDLDAFASWTAPTAEKL
mgnify:CR=1 FL=1